MRTQLDDLRAEIRLCEINKKQAAQEKDIQKWRYWDKKEQHARLIIYNIQ
jgi:hypothetical protein|tara:strand:- start:89 stop:238 length:150 start_codon:yes stop_codon:yes gene_type:complete